MFVRFREAGQRLQLSLIETRRVDGKVQHEHVAGLGSIGLPATTAGRIEFWRKLHERMSRLANRIKSEDMGKIIGAVHARVPMVTVEEMRELKLENAEADERQQSQLRDMFVELAEGKKGLAALAEQEAAAAKENADAADRRAVVARDRVASLKNGEDVPGFGPPMSWDAMLKALGWTKSDMQHALRLAALDEIGVDPRTTAKILVEKQRRAEKSLSKKLVLGAIRAGLILFGNKADTPSA